VLFFGCSHTEQVKSISAHNQQTDEMRKATLDNVFVMMKQMYSNDRKLVEIKDPSGTNNIITVYRYDNGGIEQIMQIASTIIKDSDFVKFPTHPLVGFMREIKETVIGGLNSPTASILAGGAAAKWLADSVGSSAGHNTSISAGNDITGNDKSVPTTTTTTTTTENTETITNVPTP
jgi:hypothetical protein